MNRGKRVKKKKLPKFPIEIVHGQNPLLRLVKDYYDKNSKSKIVIEIRELPPSANAIYEKSIYKNHKTNKHSINVNLSSDVEAYRIAVRNFFRKNSISFKPQSILGVVVELYTPKWLNKDLTPKEKDADNMIKPLFDAIEKASDIPDETIFNHHPFKMYGEKEVCLVTLYEIDSKIFTS